MERLAATNFIKRLVYSNDIRADLQKFGTMLSDANERLKVRLEVIPWGGSILTHL